MKLTFESCSLELTGRLLEFASNCKPRWMVIDHRIRLTGRLFLKPCWPRIEMCGASSIMRNFLVEVFAVVKVNLLLFKGKIAGMRANMRAEFFEF